MPKETKTKGVPLDLGAFLAGIDGDVRKVEARRLLTLFAAETGWKPQLWGPSIIGFGRYAYRYESGTSGESLAVGFSMRKAEISLYGLAVGPEAEALLPKLGPHRTGKACLYVKRLSTVDETVLSRLIRTGLAGLARRWPIHPA